MSTVITVGGIKGGPGKTTVAVNLAIYLWLIDKDVILIDSDDQETASDFTYTRTEYFKNMQESDIGYKFSQLRDVHLYREIPNLRQKYEYIIIDTGGRDTQSLRAALAATDILLSPFEPANFSTWTVQAFNTLVKNAQMQRLDNPFKALAFINRGLTQGNENKMTEDMLNTLDAFEYFPHIVCNRKSILQACNQGLSVLEMSDKDPNILKSREELQKIFSHLMLLELAHGK